VTHAHAHLGLFTCTNCGCAITAQKQRAHTYYHCTNGKGNCTQTYVREEVLDTQILNVFEKISFDEQLVEIMYQASLEKIGLDNSHNEQVIANLNTTLTNLSEKKNRLLDVYLAGNIDKDDYELKQSEIQKEIVSVKQQIEKQENELDPRATIEQTKNIFLASNRAKSAYEKKDSVQKRIATFNLLLNATLDGTNADTLY